MKSDVLEELNKEQKQRAEKFFDFHGVSEPTTGQADEAWKQFVKENQAEPTVRGFFHAPLARMAFMVGYARGRTAALKEVG